MLVALGAEPTGETAEGHADAHLAENGSDLGAGGTWRDRAGAGDRAARERRLRPEASHLRFAELAINVNK